MQSVGDLYLFIVTGVILNLIFIFILNSDSNASQWAIFFFWCQYAGLLAIYFCISFIFSDANASSWGIFF